MSNFWSEMAQGALYPAIFGGGRPGRHGSTDAGTPAGQPGGPPQQYPVPFVPSTAPANMSSLTRYTVKVKDDYVVAPRIPLARLDPVDVEQFESDTSLEDRILGDAESDTPLDGIIGNLQQAGITATPPGGGAALPFDDPVGERLQELKQACNTDGFAVGIAVAKYGLADFDSVLKFCQMFASCKQVLMEHSETVIAAVLFEHEDVNQTVNVLLTV